METELLPMGERAVLVEVGGTAEVLALAAALADTRSRADQAPGWARAVAEVVPAARTLLLRAETADDLPAVREGMSQLAATVEAREEGTPVEDGEAGAAGETVVVPVTYDGPDLAEVAGLTGLDEEEVVRAHTEAVYRVAFIGFAPGFAYLAGGDPRLAVPRRSTPRSAVPAGSVGLAGEFTGVYPRSSPGGWQLVGRTAETLWDVDREPPALLVPGARVRFEVAR